MHLDGSRCSPVTSPKPMSHSRSSSTTRPRRSSWPRLAVEPNKRRRLIVELLARTGMRVGELGGLRDDAMYRLGDTWWLRIPIGKLHNERTVPLHPMLVGLINDYRAWRGPTATGLLVERDDHQPMDPRTIYRHVTAVARRAGVAHVHPHALRHTLATQCINRGMSLEAIAALLGHRSPRMTLVYARISDTTVAEQYFTATGALEAGNDTPRHAPTTTPCATPPSSTDGCSATVTAPDPSSWTAASTRSAKAAASSRPDPSSSPSCDANATTPPPTATTPAPSLYNDLIDVIDDTQPDTAAGTEAAR